MKIITYQELLQMAETNNRELKKVEYVSIGIFEPLRNCVLKFSLPNLDIKPFEAFIKAIPLYIENSQRFILGSQTLPEDDGLNTHYPGDFGNGGAFLMEDLLNRKKLPLKITGYPNDVFTGQELKVDIGLKDLQDTQLEVDIKPMPELTALVNSDDRLRFTEHGVVKNNWQSINYQTSGFLQLIRELSSNIQQVFIGGAKGRWLSGPAGDLKLIGSFSEMDTLYVSALSLKGYGIYLAVGIGAVLKMDTEGNVLQHLLNHQERPVKVLDVRTRKNVMVIPWKDLLNPRVTVKSHQAKVASLSSLYLSRRIAERLTES